MYICTVCMRMCGCLCVRLPVRTSVCLCTYLCVSVYGLLNWVRTYVRTSCVCGPCSQALPLCWSARPLKTHLTMSCLSVCVSAGPLPPPWGDVQGSSLLARDCHRSYGLRGPWAEEVSHEGQGEVWSGVVWGWSVSCGGGGVRMCKVTCEMWSAVV